MDERPTLPEPSDKRFRASTQLINEYAAIASGGMTLAMRGLKLLKNAVQAYENQRSREFAAWLVTNGSAWCGICERTLRDRYVLPQLIEAFDLTDEYYRASLVHSEIADVCRDCIRSRKDGGPNTNLPRRFEGMEYDLLPVESHDQAWFVNRAAPIPDMSQPADERGLRPCVAGPPDWQPVRPGTPLRFAPEFVPDEAATAAGLPLGITVGEPQPHGFGYIRQGDFAATFDGK